MFFDKWFRRKTATTTAPILIPPVPAGRSRGPAAYAGSGAVPVGILSYGAKRTGGEKWAGGISGSGQAIWRDHRKTRRNARNTLQDSPVARAIVERRSDTISDGGLRPEFVPDISILGITKEQAKTWAQDAETRFKLWANDKKAHRAEQMTFNQAQVLYQEFRCRDNDVFWRFFYEEDPQRQSTLQFDFVDPDLISSDGITSTDGNYFGGFVTASGSLVHTDGLKIDERGREIEYKVVYLDLATNKWVEKTISATDRQSGRPLMRHVFKREYAGQRRGFSPLAHAIQEFHDITGFSSAVIQKAVNQASMVGFVEPSKDEDPGNPFEGILTDEGAGPAVSQYGSDPQPAPDAQNVTTTSTSPVTCYSIPEATLGAPGNLIITGLTKGTTLKFLENMSPADSYDKFIEAFTSWIAASLRTPIEMVLMKFNQNYSASRATLLLFWRYCLQERENMAVDFLNPIVEIWMAEEIAAGRISAPGWSDSVLRAAWLNCKWIGLPAPDIDPYRMAKARKENLEMHITNVEREAIDHNGSDAATNIEKNMAAWSKITNDPPWKKTKENNAV